MTQSLRNEIVIQFAGKDIKLVEHTAHYELEVAAADLPIIAATGPAKGEQHLFVMLVQGFSGHFRGTDEVFRLELINGRDEGALAYQLTIVAEALAAVGFSLKQKHAWAGDKILNLFTGKIITIDGFDNEAAWSEHNGIVHKYKHGLYMVVEPN